MDGAPWHEPAVAICRGKDKAIAAMARYVWSGAVWTQSRLAACKLSSTAICQACKGATGTMSHRVKCCPVWDRERAEVPTETKELWAEGDAFVERGLIARRNITHNIPCVGPLTIEWIDGNAISAASGDISVDGSGLLFPWLSELSRCGWGVVATCGRQLTAGFYGTLPGDKQTVPRAELWGIYEALKWAVNFPNNQRPQESC